nr:MAG TPA: hypothetical protein [Caudoviricetes sp.]
MLVQSIKLTLNRKFAVVNRINAVATLKMRVLFVSV